jgi:hypothetical protein
VNKKTLATVVLIGVALYLWNKNKTIAQLPATPLADKGIPSNWVAYPGDSHGFQEDAQPVVMVQGDGGFVNVNGVMQPL